MTKLALVELIDEKGKLHKTWKLKPGKYLLLSSKKK